MFRASRRVRLGDTKRIMSPETVTKNFRDFREMGPMAISISLVTVRVSFIQWYLRPYVTNLTLHTNFTSRLFIPP